MNDSHGEGRTLAYGHGHDPRQREPLPLSYQTPVPPDEPSSAGTVRLIARFGFGLGSGIFLYGFGCWLVAVSKSDVPWSFAWGGGLMALTMPTVIKDMLRRRH